jgi:hypothetical protein
MIYALKNGKYRFYWERFISHVGIPFPMGKTERTSREEIKRFIQDGWNFRVKRTSGKSYITRRKGQKERSLGSYTEELWNTIEQLLNPSLKETEELTELDIEHSEDTMAQDNIVARVSELTGKIDKAIMLRRGVYMMQNCFYNVDGFCEYWRWEERPSFFDIIDKLWGPDSGYYSKRRVVLSSEPSMQWMIKASITYCATCNAYLNILDFDFEKKIGLTKDRA